MSGKRGSGGAKPVSNVRVKLAALAAVVATGVGGYVVLVHGLDPGLFV